MDAYPGYYIVHNLPFVILSGLGVSNYAENDPSQALSEDPGFDIQSRLPPINGRGAEQLLARFLKAHGHTFHRSGAVEVEQPRFIFKVIGREYALPPRKALPPTHATTPSLGSAAGTTNRSSPLSNLHSPISPLSFGSPTYPDGIFTPLWVMKHQNLIPAAFVSFYSLSNDPDQMAIEDDCLKSEIREIKQIFESSGYRTKFVVVLLGSGLSKDGNIEERISQIRRGTGLDSRSLFFAASPDAVHFEEKNLVDNLLSALQHTCMDYYRELSKHARRKKNRAVIPLPTTPPTSGTSQTLSSQGWGVRYDFKLGVFAEFRQDLDAAGRNYESAYEGLLGPDVFESIASWNPRFTEARLFADIIAIRILRCLLWSGQTTSAARSWSNHRARLRELIDRKGKGSSNYGWEAWEAIWAMVMAELVRSAKLPVFDISHPPLGHANSLAADLAIFSGPEKGASFVDVLPFEHLHHPGYWLKLSASHLDFRRRLANNIPAEDRASPLPTVTLNSNRTTFTYDSYLCCEPHEEAPLSGRGGVDHSALILTALGECLPEYLARQQLRTTEEVQFWTARELLLQQNYPHACQILKPLWSTMRWRTEGWWNMVSRVGLMLRECARHIGDFESVLLVEWELYHCAFSYACAEASFLPDIHQCLDGMALDSRAVVTIDSKDIASLVSATYTFPFAEGNVGEPLRSQLTMQSSANAHTSPIVFSELLVNFQGCLNTLRIRHRAQDVGVSIPRNSDTSFIDIELSVQKPRDGNTQVTSSSETLPPSFYGYADLSLAPGQTKIFEMRSFLREAGDVSATTIRLCLSGELFDLSQVISVGENAGPISWWVKGQEGLARRAIRRVSPHMVKILPRPPKMKLDIPSLQGQFYTDESIALDVSVINGEDEEAEVALDVRLLSRSRETPQFRWLTSQYNTALSGTSSSPSLELPAHRIGRLPASSDTLERIEIEPIRDPGKYVFEVKVVYRLLSDLETPISKILATSFAISRPFEANYEFSPRIHPDPWPSLFLDDAATGSVRLIDSSLPSTKGLPQRWHLAARIASFAKGTLLVVGSELLAVEPESQATICVVSALNKGIFSSRVDPGGFLLCEFITDIMERSLDERRTRFMDLQLKVFWKRSQEDQIATCTVLSVPRMQIPFGEPRVIASAWPAFAALPVVVLEYSIENPSMHFLTFTVTMETNEEFAFSGPKTCTVRLVPVSRVTIRYQIFPHAADAWVRPRLHVVDRYFNKLLKVNGGEGILMDKGELLVTVNLNGCKGLIE